MKYELIKAVAQGLPTTKDGVFVMPTIIYTGIVGQTYTGFKNVDLDYCPINTTDTVEEVEDKMTAFGVLYVEEKYPNT